ncbi:MAG TPA: sulfotransferase, partial [Woeseiaceae bacterium]|nr:sulfotransferase [Woeseiaceae bacterium]
IDEARRIYEELLQRHPNHQRFHYELCQLRTAKDFEHVSQMKAMLRGTPLPPPRNIFLYYALGKELEDLEAWDEAFEFYETAGNAVKSVADYQVDSDLELIDALIETCDECWLQDAPPAVPAHSAPTPIFIVGLPRSGTTLTERMVASHSHVRSIGETFFLQMALCCGSGSAYSGTPGPAEVRAASTADIGRIASLYLEAVDYKLGSEPYFIDKLPENFLYLGFVAKAFPGARIIHVKRHPMDVCFAMYKQSYFRFAYTLEDAGRFYVAYDDLMGHWRSLLGDGIREIQYEDLVARPEHEIQRLLDYIGLDFEAACTAPHQNPASSRTASKIQIREGIHQRSIGRWKRFERHLTGLEDYLVAHGIDV